MTDHQRIADSLSEIHRLSLEAALERAARAEPAAWLYTYPHDGEQDHCLSLSRFLPSWVEAKGATETPLYAHPARGGVDEAMVERAARVVAYRAGEDFDHIGEFAQGTLLDTQRAALRAAALPAVPDAPDFGALRSLLAGLDSSPNTLAARISWTDSVVNEARRLAAAPAQEAQA